MNCPIGVSDRDLLVSLNRLAIVTGAMYLVSEVRCPKKNHPVIPLLRRGGAKRRGGLRKRVQERNRPPRQATADAACFDRRPKV